MSSSIRAMEWLGFWGVLSWECYAIDQSTDGVFGADSACIDPVARSE